MLIVIIEGREVPLHIQREQGLVDAAVSRYKSKKSKTNPNFKPAKVFVKHHPHRAETTIKVPTEHADNLRKHLQRGGIEAGVHKREGTSKYKTLLITHPVEDLETAQKDRPYKPPKRTLSDMLGSLHRKVHRSITTAMSGLNTVVLHNLRRVTGKHGDAWECIPDRVFDLVERLDELSDQYAVLVEAISSDELRDLMAGHGDRMRGGKADARKPDDFDFHQLLAGVNVEAEHTDDPAKALEIAMDHLAEHPDYYSRLDRAGLVDEPLPDEAVRGL